MNLMLLRDCCAFDAREVAADATVLAISLLGETGPAPHAIPYDPP